MSVQSVGYLIRHLGVIIQHSPYYGIKSAAIVDSGTIVRVLSTNTFCHRNRKRNLWTELSTSFYRWNYSKQAMCFSTMAGEKDALAGRPTKVCDPYGQGGKPLSGADSSRLLDTLDSGWQLLLDSKNDSSDSPRAICKEFYHPDYIAAAKFISILAAVGHMNNHYPCLMLERRLLTKERAWKVVSKVKCYTPTLGGLSHHDFYVAMLIDVEAARDRMAPLLLKEQATTNKINRE